MGLDKTFLQAKTFTKLLTPFLLCKNKYFFGKAFFSKERFAIKGLNEVDKVIKGSKVLIMGLSYKENVPDTRESPVREIIKELKEFGIEVYGYDSLLSKEEIEAFGVKALDFSFSTNFSLKKETFTKEKSFLSTGSFS
jgi:UDP-glucose 6-dehydrogenase